MRGNRVVVPKALQGEVVKLAHVGHQGIEKTKRLLRAFVWFDGIDDAVELAVKKCKKCQCNVKTQRLEPLRMTKMPEGPWENLSIDYYGPLKSGHYLLVIVDEHSRYPVVRKVTTTSFKALKPILDDILGSFGVPIEIKSDNGPPFNSNDFKLYSEANGFRHRRITPLWPRANATCERFMKNLGKVLRNSEVDGSNWEVELLEFLRSYRATPHSTTGVSPNQLLFKTKSTTSRMPVMTKEFRKDFGESEELTEKARIFDSKKKEKMKAYADKKLRVKESKIKVGDLVLVLRDSLSKRGTSYTTDEYEVVKVRGSQATVVRGDRRYKRNLSMLKKVGSVESKDELGVKVSLGRPVMAGVSVSVDELVDQVQGMQVESVVEDGTQSQEIFGGQGNVVDEKELFLVSEDLRDEEDKLTLSDGQSNGELDQALSGMHESRTRRKPKPIERFGDVVSSDWRKPRSKVKESDQ